LVGVVVVVAIVNLVVQVDMQKDIILPVRHKLWLWVLVVLVLDIIAEQVWVAPAVLADL
jgi:hypothetical protein